jgi:hypothetical protein
MNQPKVYVQGWLIVAGFVISVHLLIGLWPAVQAATAGTSGSAAAAPTPTQVSFFFGHLTWSPSTDAALLALVGVAGVLGSLLHTMNSFAVHVADNDFRPSWNWWYLIRPLVGAGLALLTYLLIRGQLLGLNGPTTDLNPYGVAGLAALTGLFSKQAVTKLGEVFDTLFAPVGKTTSPTITSVNPPTLTAGQAATVTVNGTAFAKGLTATIDGTATDTANVTTKAFDLTVSASAATAGSHTLIVTNPDGASTQFTLTVQ